MSVPAPNHTCWQRLATGGLSRLNTQNLGAQLLAKRLERSTDPVNVKAAEIHAFFVKWERVLTQELAQLSRI
jgi:hypothetical protein